MNIYQILLWVCSVILFSSTLGHCRDVDPEADAFLERHIQAIGGKAALEKIRSQRLTGYLERHGNKVPVTRTQKAPNKLLIETRFPRPGTLKQGFDGRRAWILHPIQGSRILNTKETAEFAQEAWLHPALRLTEVYAVRRWLGPRIIDGQRLVALSLAKVKADRGEIWFFDESTALLARVEHTADGGTQGDIPIVIRFEEYTRQGGIMMPSVIRTKVPVHETVLRIQNVEQNLQVDDEIFQVPP